MIVAEASAPRELKTVHVAADFVVVGGGLSGTCAAIAAARAGLKVALVQDRPVLGGNASSEVRLWILGATSHGGNNNRWAREGGIINELLLENQFRNPGGNPVVFDSLVQDWVGREPNLTVLVNTQVFHALTEANRVREIHAFNSQNSTMYRLTGDFFADSSGDGILVHMSGAAYRMGAEQAEEFDEPMAPGNNYGELLGHSMYFYTKDVGHPVDYVAPDFALKDVPALIPRYRRFRTTEQGCSLWWIEWGGRLDTIHQSEEIKGELQRIVYGVWNYIKNSGQFPEAANLTLEWVGTIPGKRESRRAEGDYILRQKDIIEQVAHDDDVCHGGWSIDLHPADGVYGDEEGCNQYHAKGVYGIPYRSMYSRNIDNLFTNGRLLSASHVAFGSTRVMATSSTVGQAIGTAAALCVRHRCRPRDITKPQLMAELKKMLSAASHYVPHYDALGDGNLARQAKIAVSSTLALGGLRHDGGWKRLTVGYAQLLPGRIDADNVIHVPVRAEAATTLSVELRISERPENHTPELLLKTVELPLRPGEQTVAVPLPRLDREQYLFVCFTENPAVAVGLSSELVTGLVAVKKGGLDKVSTTARQEAPDGLGVHSFDFWVPERRPDGRNIAFTAETPVHVFAEDNLVSGPLRPISGPNAWMADRHDPAPTVELGFARPIKAARLSLYLDCDYDHPLESVQYRHHDRVMPLLVHAAEVRVNGRLVAAITDNRSPVITVDLPEDEEISSLSLGLSNAQGHAVSLLGLRIA
ncbi:FAD-dependent oxidoreductase [Pleomorphomonas carboxyditropha]|uniref:FAD-binding dehydrogenase n=1 Tax=Pleomorphomonas carboxyditropha TaxID=2023338 RepID=A0A2G9WQF3_9HYPH|nr:FAD-dependent oxidoreductase [Pleomorphomonas carboxyditropha]PIO96951.1 FAD-binding dehydrogenase [Pleomorphomonas carboxyditropha]